MVNRQSGPDKKSAAPNSEQREGIAMRSWLIVSLQAVDTNQCDV